MTEMSIPWKMLMLDLVPITLIDEGDTLGTAVLVESEVRKGELELCMLALGLNVGTYSGSGSLCSLTLKALVEGETRALLRADIT